jgi:hypothetical protein
LIIPNWFYTARNRPALHLGKESIRRNLWRSLRSALLWDITQRRAVILYRRFETTYRSHFPGSRSPRRSQKSAELIYVAAKARNHAFWRSHFNNPTLTIDFFAQSKGR